MKLFCRRCVDAEQLQICCFTRKVHRFATRPQSDDNISPDSGTKQFGRCRVISFRYGNGQRTVSVFGVVQQTPARHVEQVEQKQST